MIWIDCVTVAWAIVCACDLELAIGCLHVVSIAIAIANTILNVSSGMMLIDDGADHPVTAGRPVYPMANDYGAYPANRVAVIDDACRAIVDAFRVFAIDAVSMVS